MLRVIKPSRAIHRPFIWLVIGFSGIVLAANALPFLAKTPQSPAADSSHVVKKNVAVPMRDGIILRADVLLPAESGRFPTLVYRTPYNKESAFREGNTFEKVVARGYAVVVQDLSLIHI